MRTRTRKPRIGQTIRICYDKKPLIGACVGSLTWTIRKIFKGSIRVRRDGGPDKTGVHSWIVKD